MKDQEFSAVGAEFDAPGRELSFPPQEGTAAPELDRSGQEYRQRSGHTAAKKRKRRIQPGMVTVAAAMAAVVTINALGPVGTGRRDYPNRVPGEQSKVYLDYAAETVRRGEFDELLSAVQDPRLERVIREEFAPFAM